MYNNAPVDYVCPICLSLSGVENEKTMIKQDDFVYRDDLVSAFISSKFIGVNEGHVLVVPNRHFENIYEIDKESANRIFEIAQYFSLALKEVRKCEGITILQNNEPASEQHAFHYHMHVIPRFEKDNMYDFMLHSKVSTPDERNPYSEALKKYVKDNPTVI